MASFSIGLVWGSRGSRRTPRRKSRPSLRQFLAMAENCSRCHLTMSLEPTLMGVFTRMQAPDGEVSSMVAGSRLGMPSGSSQETSATAHKTVLGSKLRPSMPCLSAGECGGLVTSGVVFQSGMVPELSGCGRSGPSFARLVRVETRTHTNKPKYSGSRLANLRIKEAHQACWRKVGGDQTWGFEAGGAD